MEVAMRRELITGGGHGRHLQRGRGRRPVPDVRPRPL